jgi:hypothetical protein
MSILRNLRPSRPALGPLAWAAVCLACAGCGKGQGDVHGKVTYAGKALSFGTVRLMDSDGIFHAATIEADGTYRFEKVPEGPATFVVTCMDPSAPKQLRAATGRAEGMRARSRALPAGAEAPKGGTGKMSLIPLEYGDFSRSKLKRNLEPGENLFDLTLTEPGGKDK